MAISLFSIYQEEIHNNVTKCKFEHTLVDRSIVILFLNMKVNSKSKCIVLRKRLNSRPTLIMKDFSTSQFIPLFLLMHYFYTRKRYPHIKDHKFVTFHKSGQMVLYLSLMSHVQYCDGGSN